MNVRVVVDGTADCGSPSAALFCLSGNSGHVVAGGGLRVLLTVIADKHWAHAGDEFDLVLQPVSEEAE